MSLHIPDNCRKWYFVSANGYSNFQERNGDIALSPLHKM